MKCCVAIFIAVVDLHPLVSKKNFDRLLPSFVCSSLQGSFTEIILAVDLHFLMSKEELEHSGLACTSCLVKRPIPIETTVVYIYPLVSQE